MANFTGQFISQSYQRILQIDGGVIQNGTGSAITNATIGSLSGSFSGSLAGIATSASYAITSSKSTIQIFLILFQFLMINSTLFLL